MGARREAGLAVAGGAAAKLFLLENIQML